MVLVKFYHTVCAHKVVNKALVKLYLCISTIGFTLKGLNVITGSHMMKVKS